MNRYNRAQLLGLIGVCILVAGVFRPALALGGVGFSLYDGDDVIAWPLVIVGLLALICIGRRYWIGVAVLGIAGAATTGIRLATLTADLAKRQSENDWQMQQNRGWGQLFQAMTPKLHWQGWTLLFVGAVGLSVIGVVEYLRHPSAPRFSGMDEPT